MGKGPTPHYRSGDHLVICDVCGFAGYRSEMQVRWDGRMVCPKDFEERHPQDFVRGRIDNQRIVDGRSEPPDRFIDSANPVKGTDL